MTSDPGIPTLQGAVDQLCSGKKIQTGEHIRPLHAYCAARLVVEGGFPPDWVNPRPPFAADKRSNAVHTLEYSARKTGRSETRVLGGVKYKDVDVAVVVPSVGPALAISAKNTGNAFRNLTNRMEEALGECSNVHLMYPGFVFGFLHLIRLTRLSDGPRQDASFTDEREPLPAITRYHDVLCTLSGRSAITDPGMRYEAVGMLVYECSEGRPRVWHGYPPQNSPVHFSRFFQKLYDMYDLRYGYPDPDGPNIRKAWISDGKKIGGGFDEACQFPWAVRLSD